MPDNTDYRKYLETKFEGIHTLMNAHFHDTHDRLDKINGKIIQAEEDIEDINNDLTEYRMVKKYPKIAIGVITFFVIAAIIAFIKVNNKQIELINTTHDDLKIEIRNMDGVSKQSRGGYVKYRDVMGFTDSVKIR